VLYGVQNEELDISFTTLTDSFAANCAGLAVGCFILVPLAVKYGRRPVYIISTAAMLGSSVWMGKTYTAADVLGSNVISGIFGAISESIVQMTIADCFFVHQRARMNSVYILMVNLGTFLAPVATGYCSNNLGWRWVYWITTILFGILLFGMVFAYEETKYIPRTSSNGYGTARPHSLESAGKHPDHNAKGLIPVISNTYSVDAVGPQYTRKSLKDRFALVTTTPGGSRPFLALVLDFVTLLR
jgi:MFS family permease